MALVAAVQSTFSDLAVTEVYVGVPGAPGTSKTVNTSTLVPVLPPVVTEIEPVVAPLGTSKTSCVDDAESTVTDIPLRFTELSEGAGSKPVPNTVTTSPGLPRSGLNPITDTSPAARRRTSKRLPAGS